MTNRQDLRDWLFRGLAAEELLDSMEQDGIAVRASADPRALQRVLPLEDFPLAIRRAALDALPAYLAFFCLESSVRAVVSERLSEVHGADWWAGCATAPVAKKVEDRKSKEGPNRWHTRRGAHEIHYTDFGDLKAIIRKNFVDFEDLFPDENWVVSRLDELEASRNIIAHSNVLEDRELSRVRLYLDDWLRQVG